MQEIWISDWDGFCASTKNITVDDSMLKNAYINDYGISFIKIDGNLYVDRGIMNSTFERVRSEYQIERAFSPDRVAFEEWRKSK